MKINPTKTIKELMVALSYVMDIEGTRNLYHGWRVAMLAARIAKNKISSKKLKDIFYAGLVHDIGGVEFSHHIIHYLKYITKASRRLLLSHPITGAEFVSHIPRMNAAAKLILDHHEWINGAGYPRAKTKEYIPFGSQVLRISDSVDIGLQTNRLIKLRELRNKMSVNLNKEYTQGLFEHTFNILKEKRFFYKISKYRNIPVVFEKIKNEVGFIHIPLKIDAIGATLEVIAQIIDMKHPYTWGHSNRVSRYAMSCALAMNLDHAEVTRIKWAGLIHDIGKIGVPRKILDKPTRLSREEFGKIKKHAQLTHDIMEMIPSLEEISPIAASHHESFNGKGYPQGLTGTEIPLGGRILSVCDAFDAMTSTRPYHEPFNLSLACDEIKKLSGTQFDSEILKYAIPIFKNLAL